MKKATGMGWLIMPNLQGEGGHGVMVKMVVVVVHLCYMVLPEC